MRCMGAPAPAFAKVAQQMYCSAVEQCIDHSSEDAAASLRSCQICSERRCTRQDSAEHSGCDTQPKERYQCTSGSRWQIQAMMCLAHSCTCKAGTLTWSWWWCAVYLLLQLCTPVCPTHRPPSQWSRGRCKVCQGRFATLDLRHMVIESCLRQLTMQRWSAVQFSSWQDDGVHIVF